MAPPTRLSKLALICLASSIVPSATALRTAITAAQVLGVLEQRASTCANSSFTQCSDSKLPSSFCCDPGTTCISLDNASTSLCCPTGQDCTQIQPITCDTSAMNVTQYPGGAIHSTKLSFALPTCGSNQCCPFGYTCNSNVCVVDKSTSSLGTSSSAPSSTSSLSSTSAPTSSPSSTANPTASGQGIDSNAKRASHRALSGAAIAGIAIACLVVGMAVALLAIFFWGRHRNSKRPKSSSTNSSGPSKYSHFRNRSSDGAIIGVSEPIPAQQQSVRTDFLRRGDNNPNDPYRNQNMLQRSTSRVKSFFSTHRTSVGASPYNRNNYSIPPVPMTNIPVTPPQSRPGMMHREPSTESIKIYSPPSMANLGRSVPIADEEQGGLPGTRPNTTFTDMLEKSGFRNENGSPYYKVNGTPSRR